MSGASKSHGDEVTIFYKARSYGTGLGERKAVESAGASRFEIFAGRRAFVAVNAVAEGDGIAETLVFEASLRS